MKGVIMITGGGNGKVFAAIGATYPKGSTCTCSNKFFDKMIKGQTGTADGVFADVDTHITSEAYIPVVAGVTYTVNAPSVNPGDTAGENGVVFFKEDKSFLNHSTFGSETYVYFAAPADAAYMKLNFYVKTQPETMYTDISVLSGEKEKVLKAKNTSGAWIFTVPFVGTWAVKAADSTKSKSETVAITAEGQSKSVTLSYALELLKNGILATGYEFGFTKGSYSAGTGLSVSSSDACGFCLMENCKVNVDNFTTMKIKVGEATKISGTTSIGLYNGYNTGYIGYSESQNATEWAKYGAVLTDMGTTIGIAKQEIKKNTEYVYDITALTGDWAVKLSANNSNMTITDIIFE